MRLISIFALTFLVFLQGCATNKSRRVVSVNKLHLVGGVYEDKSWNDKLEFVRLSFYQDATMVNEVLLTHLDGKTPFYNWLGVDSESIKDCQQFMVALVYADINSKHNSQFLISQIEKSGIKEVSLLDFSHHFKAHQNAQDWNLTKHKVIGLCGKTKHGSQISINLPGFKTQVLE